MNRDDILKAENEVNMGLHDREYYRDEKQQKIDHRKELAEQLGISENALRLRTFRLRGELTTCVKKCREKNMK